MTKNKKFSARDIAHLNPRLTPEEREILRQSFKEERRAAEAKEQIEKLVTVQRELAELSKKYRFGGLNINYYIKRVLLSTDIEFSRKIKSIKEDGPI